MRRALVVAALLAVVLAFACNREGGGGSNAALTSCTVYPAGPYGVGKGDVLEGLSFDGVREDGTRGNVGLVDTRSAACGEARALVVRVQAAFCGTCRAAAQTTGDLSADVRARARIVDVVVRDEDNDPADADTADRWRTLQDVKTAVAADPSMRFVVPQSALPRVLVIDPRSMRVRDSFSDPSPEDLSAAVSAAAAELRGEITPPPPAPVREDGRFTRAQARMIREMLMPEVPPPDPTNGVGERSGVQALGRELFDDKLLSPSGLVSCERCHQGDRNFTDGSETATGGVGGATRNTPTVVLAAWSRWQLWDGRADTLWMQALLPFENPNEFGGTRLFVAHRVFDAYRERYEALFGPMPPNLADTALFPPSGKPGDSEFDRLSAVDQEAVTRVFVNVGKAIAAYERTFRVPAAEIDRYAQGDASALSDKQKDGLKAFFDAGCAQCHWGGRLTDDAFHAIRFPSGKKDFTPDDGRIRANDVYGASEFRVDGKWSDAKLPPRKVPTDDRLLGSFKTPPLRGAAVTPPYGHGGSVPSLSMAIDLHRTLGMPQGNRFANGVADPFLVPFDADKTATILAFVGTLGLGR